MPFKTAHRKNPLNDAQNCLITMFETLATDSLRGLSKEHAILAGFDRRGRLKYWSNWEGAINKIIIDADDVAMMLSDPTITALALAHNHPSGDPRPSRQDIVTTRQLSEFCRKSGQRLIEHVIVGASENYRFLSPISASADERAFF